MQNFTDYKASTIDEIDELVGLNILPANFIENLLPPRYIKNNNMKTSHPEARIKRATILVPKNKNRALLS